tara:strand:+ start:2084 stop:2680 length:597 start_codon:yes stop_codon:yes gene_type:complete
MTTAIDNNNLVHTYLVPLIQNVDFSECDNPTQIKAIISKLITVAKKSCKTNNDPMDISMLDSIELSPASIMLSDKPVKTEVVKTDKPVKTKVVKTKVVKTKDVKSDKSDDDKSDKSDDDKSDDDKVAKATKATKATKTPSKVKKTPVKAKKTPVKISEPKDSEDSEDSDGPSKIHIVTSILKKPEENSDMEDPVSDDE